VSAKTLPTRKFSSDFITLSNITFWNSLGFFFLDFLIPFVAAETLGISGTEMGFLFSLRIIGYFLSSSFVGVLTDRYSKKILVIIGSIGRGVAYFGMYFSIVFENLPGLMVTNLSLGFMAGFFWIPLNAIISEKSRKEHRSEAFGIRNSAQGKGTMIGAVIGFFILGIFSPIKILMFLALPIYGALNFYAAFRFYIKIDEKNKISSDLSGNDSTKSNLVFPAQMIVGLLLFLLVILLSSTNASIAKPFIIPYLLTNIVNDAVLASMIYVPAGLISIFFAPKLGKIVDKINIYIGISIISITGAIITYFLINTENPLFFAIFLTFDTVIAITAGLLLYNIFSRISKEHRGKILGLQSLFENIGGIIGPVVGGIIWDLFTSRGPFILSIGIELLLIPFFIISLYLIQPYFEEKVGEKKNNSKEGI
jgi:MFS family permease